MALIDLTIPMGQGVESCPGEPRGYFMPFATIEEHGWASHQLLLYTHGGTHVDAPSHFVPGSADVASMPLDTLIGPALVADARPGGEDITTAAIKWPRETRQGTPEYFTQTPCLGLDVASYLAEKGVVMVGLDLPTPNRHHPHEVHDILLGKQIVIIEALTTSPAFPPRKAPSFAFRCRWSHWTVRRRGWCFRLLEAPNRKKRERPDCSLFLGWCASRAAKP